MSPRVHVCNRINDANADYLSRPPSCGLNVTYGPVGCRKVCWSGSTLPGRGGSRRGPGEPARGEGIMRACRPLAPRVNVGVLSGYYTQAAECLALSIGEAARSGLNVPRIRRGEGDAPASASADDPRKSAVSARVGDVVVGDCAFGSPAGSSGLPLVDGRKSGSKLAASLERSRERQTPCNTAVSLEFLPNIPTRGPSPEPPDYFGSLRVPSGPCWFHMRNHF